MWSGCKQHHITVSLNVGFIADNNNTFLICWLVVSYVPSTTKSFRDATPFTVPYKGGEARFLHRSHWESNPGPSHGSPFHYPCSTPAPFSGRKRIKIRNQKTKPMSPCGQRRYCHNHTYLDNYVVRM